MEETWKSLPENLGLCMLGFDTWLGVLWVGSAMWRRELGAPRRLPSLAAATPPNLVDRPCLRLKVYVRPTSECL